jgi:magnesium transporter
MNDAVDTTAAALTRRFLLDHPREAARELEQMPIEQVAPALALEPVQVLRGTWAFLLPSVADHLLRALPDALAAALLREMDPARAAATLTRLDEETRLGYLALMDRESADDLRRMMEYPAQSAGTLMDVQVAAFRPEITAAEALAHLRANPPRSLRSIFLIDEDQRLQSVVDIQHLALSAPERPLSDLAHPINDTVSAIDPHDEIVELLERRHIEELPVLDIHGHLLGVIRASELMRTLQESTSGDLQAMVGVSRDERALSPVTFAMRKRLLWIHINLITAFMAASVVGIFEGLIAQFTALAILMPVVAGMSGNTGAQALAVTLRGLALHEIGTRNWLWILFKELRVGFFNGIAVATTTALAVWLWSGNEGLSLVIALAMIISMSIACVAGAMVPILLTRFRQDPAQSSSIFITTVTDITGFFSFLGIATLLAPMLAAG